MFVVYEKERYLLLKSTNTDFILKKINPAYKETCLSSRFG